MFSALQYPFKQRRNRPLWHIKMTRQEFFYDKTLKQILVSVIRFSDDVTAIFKQLSTTFEHLVLSFSCININVNTFSTCVTQSVFSLKCLSRKQLQGSLWLKIMMNSGQELQGKNHLFPLSALKIVVFPPKQAIISFVTS